MVTRNENLVHVIIAQDLVTITSFYLSSFVFLFNLLFSL